MGKIELKIAVDSSLVEEARRVGVSFEEAVVAGLERATILARQRHDPAAAEARARQWAADNAEAIEDHNRRIAERGLFGDEYRRW